MEERRCELKDCEKKHYGKGFCFSHYMMQWNRSRIEPQDRCVIDGCGSRMRENSKCYRHRDPNPDTAERARIYALNKYYEDKKRRGTSVSEYVQSKLDYIHQLKEETACLDCGNFYPYYVMDFDHRDPKQKTAGMNKINCIIWMG